MQIELGLSGPSESGQASSDHVGVMADDGLFLGCLAGWLSYQVASTGLSIEEVPTHRAIIAS